MPVQIVNDNIKKEILKHLNSAEFSIYASVAWISDQDIFNVLCTKAQSGVVVEVIICDDYQDPNSINFKEKGIAFGILEFLGGKIFLLKGNHNKYCIVDLKTYINGSYNWTWSAAQKEFGLESIDVHFEEYKTAFEKALHFKGLKSKSKELYSVVPQRNIDKDYFGMPILHCISLDRNIGKIMMNDGAEIYFTKQTLGLNCVDFDQADPVYKLNSEASLSLFQDLHFLVARR
jgi:PLD-like domain